MCSFFFFFFFFLIPRPSLYPADVVGMLDKLQTQAFLYNEGQLALISFIGGIFFSCRHCRTHFYL